MDIYLNITDHCQLECAHCCHSCSPRNHAFMSDEVFDHALVLYRDICEEMAGEAQLLTIGGGEPTQHPRFFEWAQRLIDVAQEFYWPHDPDISAISLVTNGVDEEAMFRLLGMNGISAAISDDYYHVSSRLDKGFPPSVSPEIRAALLKKRWGFKSGAMVFPKGRAKDFFAFAAGDTIRDLCFCAGLEIGIDGRLWACACHELSFGKLGEHVEIPHEYIFSDYQCSRERHKWKEGG